MKLHWGSISENILRFSSKTETFLEFSFILKKEGDFPDTPSQNKWDFLSLAWFSLNTSEM